MTTEHHPNCDDDGWDHPGECIIETEFPADPNDPNWDWDDPRTNKPRPEGS